ncbi:type II toxin-antitoxin system RelB family antitoxin [Pseudanabaena minima]|uniref:type II toxin-antitoxin system RelB family antitoxin n=1 Tax=Pseudanabaena minima TaxID=890415 RepID=UPI003DA8C536
MNIKLDLPSPLEHELSIEASRLNVSLSDYILKVLTLRRDWLVLEEIEDAEDVADAEMALQEDGFIPLADVKRELGLS